MSSKSHKLLDDIGQSQKERLFHIDFKLRFLGAFNRNDLMSRFGIKAAAATRDISLYKEIAPQNLTYDTKAKTYIESDNSKPVFEYPGSQALSALCHGLGDDHVATNSALITSETPTHLNSPNLDVLAEVTKAIHQKKILQIGYRSLSSGPSTREIVPFALVDNGLRWHVRAFDRKRERFTDFVINRMGNPKILNIDTPKKQTKDADIQWNRIVEMHIVPHPRLKHPETIAAEYAMTDGMLKVQVRAAVAGYVLRRWNVDCSEHHHLTGMENHFWLQNRQTLYGVENLVIAPGYEDLNT
ncbi:MAG: WYL domain-containing protein [Candidatus Endonucleobacter bathymodioli]|uniref:WYL domain-containing protein n=1 Tax=Candidatus Endonucleibacter bathymodioli TaxID=539814 RepID=A0AA90NVG2_9GAMM|nr:WYL domain-containing protein [Candidatus Endonucleobacter bathymodioli]